MLQHMASSSEETMTDTRKRKRTISNRESARRSRMRKQKLMDDLTVEVANLRAKNNLILHNIVFSTHLSLSIEAENSVLGAQVSELDHRLKALNDIASCMNSDNYAFAPVFGTEGYGVYGYDEMMIGGVDDVLDSWSMVHVNQPLLMYSCIGS